MKKWKFVVMAVIMVCMGAAPPAGAALEVTGDVYLGFYDKYLWRGFDLSGSEGVVQGGVDLSASEFTLSYWTNVQASDDDAEGFDAGEATETDIVLDYTFDPTELLSVSLGNIFYHLDGLDDTNELYLGLNLNTLLSPALTIYWDYDEAEQAGLFITAALSHSMAVTDALNISLGALVSYNQESDYAVGNYSDFHNYELGLSGDYVLAENLSLSPLVLYSAPISNEAKEAIDSEWLTGVSLTLTF